VLWLELPGGINTSELFERCVQQGVSFAPGELFSNSDAFRSCLRINVALDWDERNLDALAVIETESKAMLATSSKRLANS
jgi:DNA-binding transcriptional MocR family regulator